MNIDKFFGMQQKKITVDGIEYTLQNIPLKIFYQLQERNKDEKGNVLVSNLYDYIFKNVIISPKVDWDNFESPERLESLMKEVFSFLSSKRPKKEESLCKEGR